MIRTSELHGMSAIDVDAATKIGTIDEIFLDLDQRMIAGLSISQGGNLLTGDEHVVVPAGAVHSIGEDAVMVRGVSAAPAARVGAAGERTPELRRGYVEHAAGMELMTRASSLAGRAIVTESGTHLGAIDDVLFDEENGRIVGYAFAERDGTPGADLGRFFGLSRDRDDAVVDYARADAKLRFGGDLIVAPDDAVVRRHDVRDARYDPATHTASPPSRSFHTPAGSETIEPAGPSVVRPVDAPVDAFGGARVPVPRGRGWRPTATRWGQGR